MPEKLECHELSCEGMQGHDCEERIEQTLRQVPGVREVKASHKEKKVKLFAAEGARLELGKVRTALTELGYRA